MRLISGFFFFCTNSSHVFFGPGSPVVGSLEVRQQPLLVIDADRVGDGRGRVGMVAPAARDLNVVNDRRSRGTAVVFPAVLD